MHQNIRVFLFLFFSFWGILVGAKSHTCIHNDISKNVQLKQTHVKYDNHPYDAKRRNLVDDESLLNSYQPIRITPYWDYLEQSLSNQNTITYIKKLVSAAITYFEQSLSVYRISDNLLLDRTCYAYYPAKNPYDNKTYVNCVGYYSSETCLHVTIPTEHFNDAWLYDEDERKYKTYVNGGIGISNSDLIIYVSAEDDYCSEGTLAYATACYVDDYGRPIAGSINFCPSSLTDQDWKLDVDTTLHELTHVLVFSPSLWDYFIDNTTGVLLPSTKVYTNNTSNGATWIITDNVKDYAKEHYNCSSLIGAPIEDDGSDGSAGSHWEEHYLNTEYMIAVLYSGLTFTSGFTFSMFADSGHYNVNFSMAEPFYFGYKEGCDFFNTNCITDGSSNFPQYYCSSSSDDGCSYESSAVAVCLLYQYSSSIPSQYRYFDQSGVGGSEFSEYCSFRDPEAITVGNQESFQSICWDTRGNELVDDNLTAVSYGINSRCAPIIKNDVKYGHCLEMECKNYNNITNEYDSVLIIIKNVENVTCLTSEQGEIKTLSSNPSLTIQCPYFDTFCISSKPFECLWGYYHDDLNQCVCSAGYTGKYCNETLSNIADGATLVPATPSPTYYSAICIQNMSITLGNTNIDVNGVYTYDGIYDVYPSYNRTNPNLYLWFDTWYHIWTITSTKGLDTSSNYIDCAIGDNSDVTNCQTWINSKKKDNYVLVTNCGDIVSNVYQRTGIDLDTSIAYAISSYCLYIYLLVITLFFLTILN